MLFLGYVTSCICRTHEHPNLRKNWRALTLQMFPQYTVYILIILCWVHPLPTNRQVAIPLLTLPLAFFQDKRRRRLLEYNIAKREIPVFSCWWEGAWDQQNAVPYGTGTIYHDLHDLPTFKHQIHDNYSRHFFSRHRFYLILVEHHGILVQNFPVFVYVLCNAGRPIKIGILFA